MNDTPPSSPWGRKCSMKASANSNTLCVQTVSVIRLNSIRFTFACVVAVCAGARVCVCGWCVRSSKHSCILFTVRTVRPANGGSVPAASSQQYTIHCIYIIASFNFEVFFIEISVHIISYFQC